MARREWTQFCSCHRREPKAGSGENSSQHHISGSAACAGSGTVRRCTSTGGLFAERIRRPGTGKSGDPRLDAPRRSALRRRRFGRRWRRRRSALGCQPGDARGDERRNPCRGRRSPRARAIACDAPPGLGAQRRLAQRAAPGARRSASPDAQRGDGRGAAARVHRPRPALRVAGAGSACRNRGPDAAPRARAGPPSVSTKGISRGTRVTE
jgi:hypothetical protein